MASAKNTTRRHRSAARQPTEMTEGWAARPPGLIGRGDVFGLKGRLHGPASAGLFLSGTSNVFQPWRP
jgi:hypothetical protein